MAGEKGSLLSTEPPTLPGATVPSTLQAFPPDEIRAFRVTNSSAADGSNANAQRPKGSPEEGPAFAEAKAGSEVLGSRGSRRGPGFGSGATKGSRETPTGRAKQQGAAAAQRKRLRPGERPGAGPASRLGARGIAREEEARSRKSLQDWEQKLAQEEARLNSQRHALEEHARSIVERELKLQEQESMQEPLGFTGRT